MSDLLKVAVQPARCFSVVGVFYVVVVSEFLPETLVVYVPELAHVAPAPVVGTPALYGFARLVSGEDISLSMAWWDGVEV